MYHTSKKIIFFWWFLTVGLMAQEINQDTSLGSLESLLDKKISTAAKYMQVSSEAPASVAVITADDISSYGYSTLAEALQSVNGMFVTYDRNYYYAGIRGFGRPSDYNNRILLLLNGHTLNENVYGSAPFGTEFALDLSSVERIEIVRGPGSVLYGSGAVFAVVNVITKNANAIDGLRASLETGSYGRYSTSFSYGREFSKGLNMVVQATGTFIAGQDLFFKEYDDPSTNNGIAEDLDQDKRIGLFANLQYRNLTFQGFASSREKGIPTGSWDVYFNAKPSKTIDQWNFLEFKYDTPIGTDKNIMARAYYDHYYYKGWYPYDFIQYDDTYGDWVGGELQYRWDFRPDNTFTIGTEYQNHLRASYKNWYLDTVLIDIDYPTDNISLYCQDEYQVTEYLSFTAGWRHDLYAGNLNSDTPRGAIVFNPFSSSTFKLLYGQAFRRPSLMEANYEAIAYYDESSNYIKPEKNQTLELVWEQKLNNQLGCAVSWYRYRMTNLIDQTNDGNDSLTVFNNLTKVRANGLEFELNAMFSNSLGGSINYSYQSNRNSLTNFKLSNYPKHLFKTNFIYTYKYNYHLAAEFFYETPRLTEQRTETKAYSLTNLNFRFTPRFETYSSIGQLARKAEFSFQIRNLFDVQYDLPVGPEYRQKSLIQDGRNYIARLGLKF
jgi:iron complex outermembrane receptor protein